MRVPVVTTLFAGLVAGAAAMPAINASAAANHALNTTVAAAALPTLNATVAAAALPTLNTTSHSSSMLLVLTWCYKLTRTCDSYHGELHPSWLDGRAKPFYAVYVNKGCNSRQPEEVPGLTEMCLDWAHRRGIISYTVGLDQRKECIKIDQDVIVADEIFTRTSKSLWVTSECDF